MRVALGGHYLLILSLFLFAFGLEVGGAETLRFETEIGPAILKHREHQKRLGQDCSVCHHKEQEGRRKPCGDCHRRRAQGEGKGDAPTYFDAKMKLCRGCHLEKREGESGSRAPILCEECHDIRAWARE